MTRSLPKKKESHEYHLEHVNRLEKRFFFGLCPVNLKIGEAAGETEELKSCSGCYSVCYSTKDAQKHDWKRHKSICKALQPIGTGLYIIVATQCSGRIIAKSRSQLAETNTLFIYLLSNTGIILGLLRNLYSIYP